MGPPDVLISKELIWVEETVVAAAKGVFDFLHRLYMCYRMGEGQGMVTILITCTLYIRGCTHTPVCAQVCAWHVTVCCSGGSQVFVCVLLWEGVLLCRVWNEYTYKRWLCTQGLGTPLLWLTTRGISPSLWITCIHTGAVNASIPSKDNCIPVETSHICLGHCGSGVNQVMYITIQP